MDADTIDLKKIIADPDAPEALKRAVRKLLEDADGDILSAFQSFAQ